MWPVNQRNWTCEGQPSPSLLILLLLLLLILRLLLLYLNISAHSPRLIAELQFREGTWGKSSLFSSIIIMNGLSSLCLAALTASLPHFLAPLSLQSVWPSHKQQQKKKTFSHSLCVWLLLRFIFCSLSLFLFFFFSLSHIAYLKLTLYLAAKWILIHRIAGINCTDSSFLPFSLFLSFMNHFVFFLNFSCLSSLSHDSGNAIKAMAHLDLLVTLG